MPEGQASKATALDWLNFAQEDLDYARQALTVTHLATGVACFHAQQAAEKALKAALLLDGAEPPRTHDLERLTELLAAARRTTLPSDIAWLTPFAVAHRYPGAEEEASRADLERAVRIAEAAVSWVKAVIG
jgi:HEPN domain-containing protein